MRWLPNVLTCVRILLTPIIVYALMGGDCVRALQLSVLAGLSDAADGFLARRFEWASRSGAYLDPIADKFLLTSLYISFGIGGLAPAEVVWIVVGRDVMILVMVAAAFLFTSIREFPPSISGKISTVIQIGAAAVILASCAASLPGMWVKLSLMLVIAGTVCSGIDYVHRGVVRFRRIRFDGGSTQG
jgi:cardiolipin synthase